MINPLREMTIGNEIIISCDAVFSEHEMRSFFDFCGEIIKFEFVGESPPPYEAIITFAKSANNALLLDGTIINDWPLTIKRYGEQAVEKETVMEELGLISQKAKSIGSKIFGGIMGGARWLLKPCLSGSAADRVEQEE